jgi:hypothetical protein
MLENQNFFTLVVYSKQCQFTLFYLSRRHEGYHNIVDSINKFSGKKFSLSLHLAETDIDPEPTMMPFRPDPDPQH